MTHSDSKRIDAAKRIVKAPPVSVYQAFMDPEALASWLPPEGMTGRVEAFQPWEGGMYRMTLTYDGSDHPAGKTSNNADVVQARIVELIPNKKIAQQIEFESDDPAFAGRMRMTWHFRAVPEGTEVSILCEHVPEGIRQEDHEEGMRSTLANLAAFLET